MAQLNRVRSFALTVAGAALLALSSSCYAEAHPAYVETSAAPVDIEVAPHAYYEGRTVYYVNDRWYGHDHGRWGYYRDEPRPLVRQRVHVERAPRAPHQVHERRPIARPRQAAPPAVRVQ